MEEEMIQEIKESPEIEEYEEEEEWEEESYRKKGEPTRLSRKLNVFFHHIDRGGTLGGEIMAGFTMFFLSICVIFMNMQIVGNVINGAVELNNSPASPVNIEAAAVYVQIYAGSVLIAIIGSLLIGIVANLPITQLSVMGLSSSLLCLVGTEAGLTYQNLLFLNFLAAVIYAIITGVPKVRELVYQALPVPVRRGLPAAAGLIFAYFALKMSGIVTTKEVTIGSGAKVITYINGTGFADMRKMYLCSLIGAAVAVILFVLIKLLKKKHPGFWSMTGGTLVFLGSSVAMSGINTGNTESIINFGRVWLIAGSQASATTPFADSYLTYCMTGIKAVMENLTTVFTQGADFSSYSGNTVALIVSGVLCYVLTAFLDADATLLAIQSKLNENASEEGLVDFESQKGIRKVLLCNAGINVLGSLFGTGRVTLSKISVAAVQDNGKSGLTAIFSCIGYIISLFVMVFPALFATSTYGVASMNQWNYFAYGNGGFIYLVQGVAFLIADVVMICIGICMVGTLKTLEWKNPGEWLPAVLTVVAAVITSNLAIGATIGMIAYLPFALIEKKKNESEFQVQMIGVLVIMIIMTVLL